MRLLDTLGQGPACSPAWARPRTSSRRRSSASTARSRMASASSPPRLPVGGGHPAVHRPPALVIEVDTAASAKFWSGCQSGRGLFV